MGQEEEGAGSSGRQALNQIQAMRGDDGVEVVDRKVVEEMILVHINVRNQFLSL